MKATHSPLTRQPVAVLFAVPTVLERGGRKEKEAELNLCDRLSLLLFCVSFST